MANSQQLRAYKIDSSLRSEFAESPLGNDKNNLL